MLTLHTASPTREVAHSNSRGRISPKNCPRHREVWSRVSGPSVQVVACHQTHLYWICVIYTGACNFLPKKLDAKKRRGDTSWLWCTTKMGVVAPWSRPRRCVRKKTPLCIVAVLFKGLVHHCLLSEGKLKKANKKGAPSWIWSLCPSWTIIPKYILWHSRLARALSPFLLFLISVLLEGSL